MAANNPWDRQQNEGVKAFKAFTEYRDMGTSRSVVKVAEKCNKHSSLIGRWCTKYQWVSRIAAWDDEQDRIMREALLKGVTAMRKKHVDMSDALFRKAAQALMTIPVDEMSTRDIVTLVDVSAKLERISRGEATERTQGSTEIIGKMSVAHDPFDELTTEELREYLRARKNDG